MKHVLIVDDEPFIREVIAMVLEEEGYGVLTAHGGQSMLGVLEKIRPDLILLDLMMTDISGTEAIRVLQSQPKLLDIPVIIVSTSFAYRCLETPNIPFVEKPFALEELLQAVHDTIGSA